MKIAFYIGSLSHGGAERVIVNLTEYFNRIGYEVIMVNYFVGDNEYSLPEGVKRYLADLSEDELTGNRAKNLVARFKKLRNIWKKERPDVIISFIGKTNIMTLATSRLLGIPVAVSVRSVPAREYASKSLKLGMHLLFPRATGIILQTNQAKSYFPAQIRKKAVILPNSLHYDFVRELYTGERKKEIVCVGRIDKNKNQKMLIEAVTELIKDNSNIDVIKDWKLVIYGDGPEKATLEQYVAKHQVEHAIVFAGVQDHIADKIQQSSIFVLPSKQEGMPNALMEAMALGMAVISTDCPCGGPADLIEDGKNGYLIPVEDKNALKVRLIELMKNQTVREQLGQEASSIRYKLHPDVVNQMWKDYVDEIAGNMHKK